MRRLREEQLQQQLEATKEEGNDPLSEDDDDEEEEDDEDNVPAKTVFSNMLFDSDSSSEEEEDDDDEEEEEEEEDSGNNSSSDKGKNDEHEETDARAICDTNMVVSTGQRSTKPKQTEPQTTGRKVKENNKDEDNDDEDGDDDDLDQILQEFRAADVVLSSSKTAAAVDGVVVADGTIASCASVKGARILVPSNFDTRDFDLDASLRSMMSGRAGTAASTTRATRTHRRGHLFGRPLEAWGQHKPPTLMGGGLGMTATVATSSSSDNVSSGNQAQEYRIEWSDSYKGMVRMYEQSVARTHDYYTLALFLADYPYCTEACLQLSIALFQLDRREWAMDLLKRTLWIYETASLSSFFDCRTSSSITSRTMSFSHEENKCFFQALFRLVQCSSMVGCNVTALAVSRFLLSLDSIHDPMATLLIMDYYALATQQNEHDQFIVDLVESKTIRIRKDTDSVSPINTDEDDRLGCDLVDMPNWGFSYALALYRLSLSLGNNADEEGEQQQQMMRQRADEALQRGLVSYPSMLQLLLEKNGVDTRVRSFQMDWPTVLQDYFTRAGSAFDLGHANTVAKGACDRVIRIFIQRHFKLWQSDPVLQWLYSNALFVSQTEGRSASVATTTMSVVPRALERYANVDPSDFLEFVAALPPDAENMVDPALVAPALALDPRRRRMLRFGPNHQNGQAMEQQQEEEQRRRMMHGGGIGPTGPPTAIDPDLPLMEIFWRSLLPWTTVDGIQPPPPPQR